MNNGRGEESLGKGGVQVSVDGGSSWLPSSGGVFNESEAGRALNKELPDGWSGRSGNVAQAWKKIIGQNLKKEGVAQPEGVRLTSCPQWKLAVPDRLFSVGPYAFRDVRVRKPRG